MSYIATDKNNSNINELVMEAEKNPGQTLPQQFYTDPSIYKKDMRNIFKKQWIMVDHVSRIPEKGQYFLFEVGNESIIIIRESEDVVNAFYNVCRHRGSRVCLESEGKANFMVCPYHAWAYNLDGSLKAARTMPEEFDRSDYALHSCYIEILHGVIFINLSDDTPPNFLQAYSEMAPYLIQQGLSRAKIAVKKNYPNATNWKLVVDNFIECYHCAPAHKEYCSVHPADKLLAFGAGPGSGLKEAVEKYQGVMDDWNEKAESLGHITGSVDGGIDSLGLHQAARYPINGKGWKSETMDGELACKKLMAGFNGCDGGQTVIAFNPFSTILASNDFAVMVRFTPTSELHTDVEITWLVTEDAVEGVDYDPENLISVWDITIKQDKKITEDNQAGIMSEKYSPGPYSLQETRNISFKAWYLKQLIAD